MCAWSVEVDLGLTGRGCKRQHIEQVPRDLLHVARSRKCPSNSLRECTRSKPCAFRVGTDGLIPSPDLPPRCFHRPSRLVDAAGRSRQQAAPSANAFRGARWSRSSCGVVFGRPAHSPSRCWNSETWRPKQSSTLGQEVRGWGLGGRPGNLLVRGNRSPPLAIPQTNSRPTAQAL